MIVTSEGETPLEARFEGAEGASGRRRGRHATSRVTEGVSEGLGERALAYFGVPHAHARGHAATHTHAATAHNAHPVSPCVGYSFVLRAKRSALDETHGPDRPRLPRNLAERNRPARRSCVRNGFGG